MAIGVFSAWPIIGVLVTVVVWVVVVGSIVTHHRTTSAGFLVMFGVWIVTFAELVCLEGVYIGDSLRNVEIGSSRALGIVLLVGDGPISIPVYWYRYLWRPFSVLGPSGPSIRGGQSP
jgi:hypothetical protein